MPVSEIQIGVRMPKWLKDDLQKAADKSAWSVSQQIRFELLWLRGKWVEPHVPTLPSHDGDSRSAKKV